MGNFAPRARILSSPSLRCLQTVGLVASAQHLTVEETDDLAEGQSSVAVHLVRSLAGQEVVVCTHGDVIAEILVALADEDRLDLGQNPKQAKGSVWALDGRAGSFTSAKYSAPVAMDAL
jgi:8-oxo-dGTP diphosphatase